ncbi:hypothetical protein JHK85_025651 [Glycine max]|nr:hypothetical protein JHK85_025651 [Glycine max]
MTTLQPSSPILNTGGNNMGQVGRKNDVVRLLPPRDSPSSSTSSPSIVSMAIRYSDVAPTPFPPLTKVRPSLPPIDVVDRPRFHPSEVMEKAITLSIRQQFANPWPTWGAIPKDHQELFF